MTQGGSPVARWSDLLTTGCGRLLTAKMLIVSIVPGLGARTGGG